MQAAAQSRDLKTLPLVMLPGTLCDGRILGPLQQRLDFPSTSVIVTQQARSLEEAAEAVLRHAPGQFVLLGFSLGGMVAMEAALRAPERIRALILIGTTPLPVPPERHSARNALVQQARTLPMWRFMRERLWHEYGGKPDDARTLPLLEQMADDLGAETFAAQTEMALRRSDFCPRLKAIACPTLIVGGADDPVCPPVAQARLAEAVPASTSVLLPGAGHFALYGQSDEVAAAVAAWLHTINAVRSGGSASVRSGHREGE